MFMDTSVCHISSTEFVNCILRHRIDFKTPDQKPNDVIWRHQSELTFAQAPMVTSHQVAFIWREFNPVSVTNNKYYLENYLSEILFKSPKGQ